MEVLEKDFDEYTVVANIPYYITTPIVTMFLESAKKVKKLVLTVQKEVADRFSAKDNRRHKLLRQCGNRYGYRKRKIYSAA